MTRLLSVACAILLLAVLLPTAATAVPPYDGADYQEIYFDMPDGTTLHADVLRAAGTGWEVEQPVILTVSPYLNHNGSTSDNNPLGGDGPNPRFNDFLELTDALDEGYTYALVDLPGFGGSGGCNDWGGPREQSAVHTAVEFFADIDFSTGSVGMIGKSYDGWTGLMGMATDPEGLDAVVSMEPVYSGYRYMFLNGVPRGNDGALGTMNNFQRYDAKPGAANDNAEYLINGTPGPTQPQCYLENLLAAENNDESFAYWQERDLVRLASGSDVPLFLTQGFLETNTEQDAAFDYFSAMDDSEGHNRAWFGQFDHVRGWDPDSSAIGRATGRLGFEDEVLSFFDEHLKGITPEVDYPAVVVQDNEGRYRAEESWPPADAGSFVTALPIDGFIDMANNGDGSGSGNGAWAVSQELHNDVRLAGEPQFAAEFFLVTRDVDFAVNVYDIDVDGGAATLVSRSTMLVREADTVSIDLQMFGQDWVFEEGHRIGVLVSGGNDDWWNHGSTGSTVQVTDAAIELPLLTADREDFLDGEATLRLDSHNNNSTVSIDDVDLSATTEFSLPE